jgi:hypothetical protein
MAVPMTPLSTLVLLKEQNLVTLVHDVFRLGPDDMDSLPRTPLVLLRTVKK